MEGKRENDKRGLGSEKEQDSDGDRGFERIWIIDIA